MLLEIKNIWEQECDQKKERDISYKYYLMIWN